MTGAPMVFYSVALPKCRCGRAAAFEIRASGGARYDHACERCVEKRIRELTRAHLAARTVERSTQ
jgi:hypothetical protein